MFFKVKVMILTFRPNKKIVVFPLTLPTLIFSAYLKVFIVNFTQALLKSGPLSLYSPYKKININKNISLPHYFINC